MFFTKSKKFEIDEETYYAVIAELKVLREVNSNLSNKTVETLNEELLELKTEIKYLKKSLNESSHIEKLLLNKLADSIKTNGIKNKYDVLYKQDFGIDIFV